MSRIIYETQDTNHVEKLMAWFAGFELLKSQYLKFIWCLSPPTHHYYNEPLRGSKYDSGMQTQKVYRFLNTTKDHFKTLIEVLVYLHTSRNLEYSWRQV